MDELISREALKQVLLSKGFYPAIVGRAIDAAPAVAAVPVVRCKECKHCGIVEENETDYRG